MTKRSRVLAVPVLVGCLAVAGSASAGAADTTVNFGCPSDDRTIAARAYYAAQGPGQWRVKRIGYSYSNSGGGKSNTSFSVYNGAGAVAWTWDTPDNRTNRSYRKKVGEVISRGNNARAWQKTWFDVAGKDPSCSRAGNF